MIAAHFHESAAVILSGNLAAWIRVVFKPRPKRLLATFFLCGRSLGGPRRYRSPAARRRPWS